MRLCGGGVMVDGAAFNDKVMDLDGVEDQYCLPPRVGVVSATLLPLFS